MFDSDSSEDLTSGVVASIGGGHRVMRTSRAGTGPTLLELLVTLVRALASRNAPPFW
jgi:hypothetical protein